MFSIDLYEFSIELPKNSTPNLRFICPMFSGDPISWQNFAYIRVPEKNFAQNIKCMKFLANYLNYIDKK